MQHNENRNLPAIGKYHCSNKPAIKGISNRINGFFFHNGTVWKECIAVYVLHNILAVIQRWYMYRMDKTNEQQLFRRRRLKEG